MMVSVDRIPAPMLTMVGIVVIAIAGDDDVMATAGEDVTVDGPMRSSSSLSFSSLVPM